MPPRIPLWSCPRVTQTPFSSQFILPLRPLSTSIPFQAKHGEEPKKRLSQDPYIVAQRNQKKAANLSRRAELEEARKATLGDPVRGVSTPFVESFETGKPIPYAKGQKVPKDNLHFNYAFDPDVVGRQLRKSKRLAIPLSEIEDLSLSTRQYTWNKMPQEEGPRRVQLKTIEEEEQDQKDHTRAAEAIARIVALENGSSKDRMRVNITRCVETFGRHNTDKIFPPRAPTMRVVEGIEVHPVRPKTNKAAARKRVGPDTGSSEVQIAILTAKIKTLADFLGTRGKGDKHNKRNLRLLVHRRQKLLQYLRRKERGGPRWQHCIEMLGLTEGTWRGEISL